MSADGGGGGGGARKGPRRGAGGNRSQGQGQGRGRGGGPHGKGRGGGRPRSDRERGFGAGPGTGRHRGSGKPRGGRERTVDPARTVARDVLRAVREREAYANLLLPKLLADRGISGRDAAFATELTYGAARELGLLDAVIAAAADRPVGDIDPEILDDLRLGAYQLLRTRVPAHAALSTTVDLVAADAGRGASGFANAVLRRVTGASAEEWIDRLTPDAAAGPVAALAFAHSHPEWIAQAFADALGADAGQLSDALAADNIAPQVHLVARPGEISAEELALITGGEPGTYSPYAVHLDGGDPGRLEPVRERLAAVQDEGSQLIALATYRAPVTGEDTGRILDLCAGPGGKTALIGALAAIDGRHVDAVEPAPHRAKLVSAATDGLPVTVHTVDGRDSGLEPGYDRVLVDAPCTGLGALRRRPEARWRRTAADVRELVSLQRELLGAAAALTRPGGVIVYATCSPHLAETRRVVADAVRRHGLIELDTPALVPEVTDPGPGPHVQLWPHRHGTDAMFFAALQVPDP